MGIFKRSRKLRSCLSVLFILTLVYAVVGTIARILLPPPPSVGLSGADHVVENARFFPDISWIDADNQRQLSQTLFDAVAAVVQDAQKLIVIDMFLFNAWQGPIPETHRSLASELTQNLIARKTAIPELEIVFISDPINTVYGGLESVHFQSLRAAGINVVQTRLKSLQDSNPAWSGLWRVLIAPFGNSPGSALPNPFGEGRVSIRSYLTLLNFKANHRKLLIADNRAGSLSAVISSANPHDGSSAHRNVALQFDGDAVLDLLAGELELLRMNKATMAIDSVQKALDALMLTTVNSDRLSHQGAPLADAVSATTLRVVSESRIHDVVLQLLERARKGDAVDLLMFYLSDRQIVQQLIAARQRGVQVRVLLDVNSDAFGRQKNGVPNRPVAAELNEAGIDVRWCATSGEQCHAKWLHVRTEGADSYLLGSANFTRRNLHDFNLETNILVQAASEDELAGEMQEYFDNQWANEAGKTYSVAYEEHADGGLWLKLQYRFMEATGLSTF